jgi:NAD(P)-dependent dehydrogenase (short-subunit alcohol dehydrogenase family)
MQHGNLIVLLFHLSSLLVLLCPLTAPLSNVSMDISGIALITGAASGIGRACALGFVRDGASGIALLDLSQAALEKIKSEVQAKQRELGHTKPCRVEIYPTNVADENRVNEVVEEAARTFGRLDYVVNAAGIAMKHLGGAAFAETTDWRRILDVNLNGTFYVLRAAARIMLKQEPIRSVIDGRPLQRGSIVNFSSIQGLVGITLSTAYTTSKHAVLGLTRTASEDYANKGLRINAICPGYTETPLTTKSPEILKAMMERVETAVPMERMGKPEEIADGVLYLSGGRSSFVTGTALSVDGGYCSR